MKKTAAASPPRHVPNRAAVTENEPVVGVLPAAGLYLLLSALFFVPAFLPDRHIFGTDYIGGGFFFYDFISERLGAGALPKWVPYVFGGMPLFANPGSTFQPVHFVGDLLFSTPRVLPFVFLIHFWLGGLGMYLLARELRCRTWIAVVAGIAFQFTGILTSWVYAGHDGRIIVASLAPLFFFCLHRGVRTERLAPFAGAAATLGFALLSFQIQNSYYLLLAAGIWGVFCLVKLRGQRSAGALIKVGALGIGSVAFGFLLTAVNFLPFLSYVPESPRGMEGGRGYEYAISFSMPPAELLSVAVPEHHGASVGNPRTGEPLFPRYRGENPFKLHTEYAGAFVILMLVCGAVYARRDSYWLFFAGLSVFMLTVAFGGHTPLYRLYFELLPGTQRFRAPSLSFFVVAFSLVAMAALTLEQIAQRRSEAFAQRKPRADTADPFGSLPWLLGAVVGVALLGAAATATGGGAGGGPTVSGGWVRFALFAALVGGAVWLWVGSKLPTRAFVLALALITLADLWLIGQRFMHTIEPPEVTFAADDVIRFLQGQPGEFRVWTFPYPEHFRGAGAYGGNFPMHFGIDQVGGEHPNMLQRWVEYVGAGTRTYIDWHNLIVEAAVVDMPDGQAIGFRGQPGFLDAANVRYIISMAPLAHPSLREVHRGSALVYENVEALPRAYLVAEVEAVPPAQMVGWMRGAQWDPRQTALVPPGVAGTHNGEPLVGNAQIVTYGPDRVVVETSASRPAVLVLADNYYDGWEVEIGGQPAEVFVANHTFRGVVVPAGEHRVEFTFRPRTLYLGLYVTIAAFLLLALIGGAALLARRRAVGTSVEAA